MGRYLHYTNLVVTFLQFFNVFFRNPTPDKKPVNFKPVTENELNFADVNNDGISVGVNPHDKQMKFWTTLHSKYSKIFTEKVRDELQKVVTMFFKI